MSIETERKFLVIQEKLILPYSSKKITQGYLNSFPERSVRVRLSDKKGYLTVKGKTNSTGVSRFEWEIEISEADAKDLFKLCEPGIISKNRYNITYGNHLFEIDVFHELNKGLIIAEIELSDENESFDMPEWLGAEVTGDKRYYNSFLSKTPYTKW